MYHKCDYLHNLYHNQFCSFCSNHLHLYCYWSTGNIIINIHSFNCFYIRQYALEYNFSSLSVYEILLLISPLFIIISTSLLLSQSPLFNHNCITTFIEGVLSCKLVLVYIINFYLSYFYVDFSPADNRSHFFPWFSQGHFGCRQDRIREDLGLCDSDDRETLFREMECRWWLGSSYYYSHSRTSIAGDHLIC